MPEQNVRGQHGMLAVLAVLSSCALVALVVACVALGTRAWESPWRGRTAVGLFVSTWHDLPGPRRVMGETSSFALHQTYWWGRPAFAGGDLARYTWTNPAMVDYHIDNFVALGVDFVFLDFTNGTQQPIVDGAHALCRRLLERRQGPKVVFWIRSLADAARFRREFYEPYDDAMFRWDGRWLLLVHGTADGWRPAPGRVKPPPAVPGFTARWCWGLLGPSTGTMWSFKEPFVGAGAYLASDGAPEQLPVAFASQASYMTSPADRKCRDGGRFFEDQARHVLRVRPRIVTVTGYNEWGAMNLSTEPGTPRFTDLASPECSHDVEPMKGGHGDRYFRQAADFVRRVKA